MPRVSLIVLLGLGACAAAGTTPVSIPPENQGAVCNDSALASFAGRPANLELGAELIRASRARHLRWVPFGGVITMDFSPHRLTVQLDRENRVATAKCG